MSVLYCKIDCNLDANPKIVRAGFIGAALYQFWLRRNRALDAGGRLPLSHANTDYLSAMLRVTGDVASSAVTACVAAGLVHIEGDHLFITGWDEQWGREANTGAERQRKYKENQRLREKVTEVTSPNVTGDESDVREEKKREEKRRILSEERGAKRATALPADWQPSSELRTLALELGVDPADQAARMRDWAKAGGETKRDWDATFRNWLRRAADSRPAGQRTATRDPRVGRTDPDPRKFDSIPEGVVEL